ncbi:MAG: hypothetical protein ACI9R3_002748, partial [Verrucomicrobiales bacterium]
HFAEIFCSHRRLRRFSSARLPSGAISSLMLIATRVFLIRGTEITLG